MKQRSAIRDKMERLLLVWIKEREMKRYVTSMPIIQDKAREREIFEKLKEQTLGLSSEELEFKSTTGWFTKFKRRSGIKHVLMHGESASADKEAAERSTVSNFKNSLKQKGIIHNKYLIVMKLVCFGSACRTVPTSRNMRKVFLSINL
ncbi:tigger transposable element-derived protein 1-like protein [Trichonephila clavata]|uniref:Tigger transposable element-derived protein 1-like protein n=1 Tax=Trichonephila clavata TaxID=2740835 RepID=A0A8X6HL71_TRICU|nr:tigger transposable element-derived protein 1-like protein [Trichonephila clavata]